MQRKSRLLELRFTLLYKFDHISVNFARRAMKLLFLERKLNFASNATIFSGLRFLNLSQNLRDFLFFAYVARDFFADSALFCLEFFRGTNFCKLWYGDWKFELFRFQRCIISLANRPISHRKWQNKSSYRNQCLKYAISRMLW